MDNNYHPPASYNGEFSSTSVPTGSSAGTELSHTDTDYSACPETPYRNQNNQSQRAVLKHHGKNQ